MYSKINDKQVEEASCNSSFLIKNKSTPLYLLKRISVLIYFMEKFYMYMHSL